MSLIDQKHRAVMRAQSQCRDTDNCDDNCDDNDNPLTSCLYRTLKQFSSVWPVVVPSSSDCWQHMVVCADCSPPPNNTRRALGNWNVRQHSTGCLPAGGCCWPEIQTKNIESLNADCRGWNNEGKFTRCNQFQCFTFIPK